ncbi:TetR/AcrR family transcriptional regulator [Amycolatopsis palatopharyngis]|uniref:TetR/AcrR family transcriptional regulator n=1 Tax=Amycolatopsis palatopharyngis TaxID=187982 RepID=UPI000E224AB1|nr:TetR/AcrR family transcriptional regulator [Amycolatopsis palatopharyngis]
MGRTSDARERIVRTAARLFLTRSYTSVGVGEICAAADVRKGSFYHYFPAKTDVAIAVIDLHAAGLEQRLREAGAAEPAQALRGVALAVGRIQLGFEERFGQVVGCPFGNLAAELSTADTVVREHLAAVFATWRQRIATVCHRAAAHGLLRKGTDPDRLAAAVLAHAQGLILLAKVDNSPAVDIAEAIDDLITAHLAEGAPV